MPTRIAPTEVIGKFGGFPNGDFAKAKVVLVPVAFDGTTSWKPGTRYGSEAILEASRYLDEIWGEEFLHPMVENDFFYTTDLVRPWGASTKEKLDSVYLRIWHDVISKGKMPFLLGGEHSLAFPNIRACYHGICDFSILQLDAHPDLRNSLDGDYYSHACAMRRAFELGGGSSRVSLVSFGIRSVDLDTREFIKSTIKQNSKEKSLHIFYAEEGVSVSQICSKLKPKVYITLDLDGLEFDATGTPEPGGLQWREVVNLLRHVVRHYEIIGMDMVELAPIGGFHAPNKSAAKLVFYLLETLYEKLKKNSV